MASLTIESLWLSDRALEQGIGRSGVRFVIGTQNFFPRAMPVTRRKTSFSHTIIAYKTEITHNT